MADAYHSFDLDDPKLPKEIEERALSSGNFPYDKRMSDKDYAKTLKRLQIELVKQQEWLKTSGERILCLFEGRDAAGKGGAIEAYREHLNPRFTITVALPKPSDREASQWYFQRYVDWLPAAGETVLFDRSWYNRAGVERVMGFAKAGEVESFLHEAPRLEQMLVNDGIRLFKFWLSIGRETQLKRFHSRRHDPLKQWKISDIDLKAIGLWDEYTKAREAMMPATDTTYAPWTVVRANDKRRARIGVIQSVLSALPYKRKDEEAIGEIDRKIILSASEFTDTAD